MSSSSTLAPNALAPVGDWPHVGGVGDWPHAF